MSGEPDFPPGFVLLGSVTQDDVSRAICIWDAPSLDDLQRMLDGMFGAAAVNDCFVADPARSFNLPAPQTADGARLSLRRTDLVTRQSSRVPGGTLGWP